MTKQRDHSLDMAGGLMLVIIILLHISQKTSAGFDLTIITTVFYFMPWFFFKAGMFHRLTDKRSDIIGWCKRLLIPYVSFLAISQLLYLLLTGQSIIGEFLETIKTIALTGAVPVNAPLWFLLSLFLAKLSYNFLAGRNILQPKAIAIVSFIVSNGLYLMSLKVGEIKPLYLSTLFTGLFFFSMGALLKERQYDVKAVSISAFIIYYVALFCPSFVDMRTNAVIQWSPIPPPKRLLITACGSHSALPAWL